MCIRDRFYSRPTAPERGSCPMEVIKQLRQREIRDLLAQRPIRTQQELAAALRDRGFRATQATISRDVAELGLISPARTEFRATRCLPASPRQRALVRSDFGRFSTTFRSMSARRA